MFIPFAKAYEAAPKENWQPNHEKGMGSQVGSDGEVAIEGWGTYRGLEIRKVGCLPSHQWEEVLSQEIPPFWKRSLVWQDGQQTPVPRTRNKAANQHINLEGLAGKAMEDEGG